MYPENRFKNAKAHGSERVKTIECLCLGTIALIVAPWKFDVLRTSIFALEASLLRQIFVFRTSEFRGATINRKFIDSLNSVMIDSK